MVSRRTSQTTKWSGLKNESGQAVFEYILIVAISVMIILGLFYQFNTAFSSYAKNFFGNYIACLIEAGELPGSQVCASQFVAFDLNNGKPLVGPKTDFSKSGSGSGGGKGGSGKDGGKSGQGSGDKGKGGSGETVAGGNGRSTPVGTAGGSGPGPTGFRFGSKAPVTPVGRVGGDDKKSAYAEFNSPGGLAPTSMAVGTLSQSDRNRATALGYRFAGDEEAKGKDKNRPKIAKAGNADQGSKGLKPKKAKVELNRAPARVASEESQEFSISGLLRFLLIIAIIIIIFVFIGGQLLQISKASEK
jgi:hypothetical protein